MTEIDYWRQLDLISPNELRDAFVTIIGVGGIGSPTALALAKMGVPEIEVWDADTVENHNLPVQLYRKSDIGRKKVHALADVLAEFTGAVVHPVDRKFTRNDSFSKKGIVISTVDSMSARKNIWYAVKRNKNLVDTYIDARMGLEVGWVQVVNPLSAQDVTRYSKTLYSDEDAVDLPCTARAVWYNEVCIAAVIGRIVRGVIKRQPVDREVTFDLNMMLFTTSQ